MRREARHVRPDDVHPREQRAWVYGGHSGRVHIGLQAVHTGLQAMHMGLQAVHTGLQAVHTGLHAWGCRLAGGAPMCGRSASSRGMMRSSAG